MVEEVTRSYCERCVKKRQWSCCTGTYPYPTIDDIRLMCAVMDKDQIMSRLQLMSVSPSFLDDIENGQRNRDDLLLTVPDEDRDLHKIFLRKVEDPVYGEKCVFLQDGVGCVLGRLRPACCRIFPYTYVTDPNAKHGCVLELDPECTAHQEQLSIKDSLKALDMDYDRVMSEWSLYAASMQEHGDFLSRISHEGIYLHSILPLTVEYAWETRDRCRTTQLVATGQDHGPDFWPLDALDTEEE